MLPVPGPEARAILPARHALKVISYNILAPRYAGYNSYCPPEFLAWEYRRRLVLSELSHHSADLLALQECDEGFYGAELSGWMSKRGMQGHFLARPVGPVPGPAEGIALLWRSAALEVVAARSAVYSGMDPRVAGLPAEVADSAPWRKLRELGEGCVLALLRHRATGALLVCCCTHLFWNPAFPDVKALQAALLCGEIASFAREAAAAAAASGGRQSESPAGEDVGVVLCGDFNSLAEKRLADRFDPQIPEDGLASGVYTLLSRGSLPPEHPDHPATREWDRQPPPGGAAAGRGGGGGGGGGLERFPAIPLTSGGLQLVSLNVEAFGREPPVTNRTAGWSGCLDYVWLSRRRLAVTSALAMPYDDGGSPPLGPAAATATVVATATADSASGASAAGVAGSSWRDPHADIPFGAIPDARYPSDHLAVGGVVLLLPA